MPKTPAQPAAMDQLTIDQPTPTESQPAPKPAATRHVLSELFSDPDLVDIILARFLELIPNEADSTNIRLAKAAVRRDFGGIDTYVRMFDGSPADRKEEVAEKVRRMFDGRNATQIARILNISRATVYRCLKQPGLSERD